MKISSFQAIVEALNEAGVKYLVVGGMAVIAHGYLRLTHDVDIVVRLSPEDIHKAFQALASIDYLPAVPVTAEQFSDPAIRESWRRDKEMLVLKMWSDHHRETPLDIFVYEPFDFEVEYRQALVLHEPGSPDARFIAIPALIAMKRVAARSRDLNDIENLLEIQKLQQE